MRKFIITLLLTIIGSTWTISSAICMEQNYIVTDDASYSIINGTLFLAPLPCYDDGEPCAPCLTVALETSDSTTYYLTGLDEQWEAYLDSLMNRVQNTMMQPINYHALLSGKTFTRGDYNYVVVNTAATIQISQIELWSYADWLTGSWEVYKEIVANGSGFGDISMRDVNSTSGWIFDTSGTMYQFMKDGTGYFPPHVYSLQHGTYGWFLTVEGLFDQPQNLGGGNSPITIYRLTDKELEWQYESYGGDEGPVTYYQFLRRSQSSLRLPSLCDTWNVLDFRYNWGQGDDEYILHRYQLTTDTVINTLHYVKLYKNKRYRGALREGNNAAIYFIPADSTSEYLLYDFNVQVGDTLDNLWYDLSTLSSNARVGNAIVTEIQETLPKTIILTAKIFESDKGEEWVYDQQQLYWIEGVGYANAAPDGYGWIQLPGGYVTSLQCAYKDGELVYASEAFDGYGCNDGEQPADTIPLYRYTGDDPGSSTVDPVDPNQIVATLKSENLTIREFINEDITYSLSKVPASNQAPARRRVMQSDSFRQSVTIALTESGTYEIELTNPEWNYSIVGTFKYMPTGVEETPAPTTPVQKVLRDGRLFIMQGDKVYTLTGMQVE